MVSATSHSNGKQTLPLIYWLLIYSAVAGAVSPLIFHNLIHNVSKAFLYGASFASSATLTVMSRSPFLDRLREKEEIEVEFRRDALRQLNVADAVVQEIKTKSIQYHGIRALLENASPEVRNLLIEEYGLDSLRSLPAYSPPPPPKDLGLQLLKVAGSEQTNEDFLEHVSSWSICRDNNMTFVGNQGEGKTNACFFALYSWIYKLQAEGKTLPIIYAFDPHVGMGRHDDYKSTWLGLPVVEDKPPQAVSSCVFHGESSQIGAWIEPVRRLYNYRKKNKIGTASGAEPVIVVIDELTSHLIELEAKRAEQVSNWMTQLSTGAPKFNIWIWVITHDMTETNTKVKTAFYRQSHVVIGAASAQASHIISSCQKNIAKGSIEIAGCKLRDPHRNSKAPACFVTSLPTPDGTGVLDTPLLSNKQMELPWERTNLVEEEDTFQDFDSEFKDKFIKDPDTLIKEQDLMGDNPWTVDVDSETVEEPEPEPSPAPRSRTNIKSRDLNQPTEASVWLELGRDWYASHPAPPTDEELAAKWSELTGRQIHDNQAALDYLRTKLCDQ